MIKIDRTDVCSVRVGNRAESVSVSAWGAFDGVDIRLVEEGNSGQTLSLTIEQLELLQRALNALDLPPTYENKNA